MNARDERAIARIRNAASQLRAGLENAPPMFERYVGKLQTSADILYELQIESIMLSPQHSKEGRTTEYLRKRLRREYMIPLARIGKRLFRFAGGGEQTLTVPHARASLRELITAAEMMLEAVQPHHERLLSAGFSNTFLTEFRDLTGELLRIATTSSERQRDFARVTSELREELANANETLRILDGLVLSRADKDPHFRRAWKDVLRTPKRLGRPPAKKRKLSPNELPAQGQHEGPVLT